MSRPCCPSFSFNFTAVPNQEQIVEEIVGDETVTTVFPEGMVFSTSQEIANCIALEITEVEERQALCELGPLAFPQTLQTDFETPLAITLSGSTPVGSTLLYYIDTPPANGELNIGTLPTLSYIPDSGFGGQDSFTFYVSNGFSDSAPATITIDVGFLAEPITLDVSYETETPIELGTIGIDPDTATYAIVTGPSHGTLSVIAGRIVNYTPDALYTGPDSFTYEADNGTTTSDPALVTITVLPQGQFVADFITLEYQFLDGLDLDTRTSMIAPLEGYLVGWCQDNSFFEGPNGVWYEWGGDNTGTGFESVLFYTGRIRELYPAGVIEGLCQAWWYNLLESGAVQLDLRAYQGGEMVYNPGDYKWANSGGTQVANITLNTTVTRNDSFCIEDPECVTGFTYDLSTNTFSWTPCV